MSQSLAFAQTRAWNLASTLMVCFVVFRVNASEFGVMPSSEYDGDPARIVLEFDPFQP